MTKWGLCQECNIICHINRKEKKPQSLQFTQEKICDKTSHHIMIKINKVSVKGNFIYMIKGICERPYK